MVVVEADMVAIASKESSGFDYLLAGHLKPVKKCLELVGRNGGGSVSFAKLGEQTLWTYMGAHDITPSADDMLSRNDLAAACSQHFSSWKVDEDALLERLLESPRLTWTPLVRGMGFNREIGRNGRNKTRITLYKDAGMESPRTAQMESMAFTEDGRPLLNIGEMVAAKVSDSDENWILACVSRQICMQGQYEVMDEDDSRHKYIVEARNTLRLPESLGGLGLQKGDNVLAMFPETTSFYPAKPPILYPYPDIFAPSYTNLAEPQVAKNPKCNALDIYVSFEDDEDDVGKTPTRRIMSKYVIPIQDSWSENTNDGG